MKSLSHNALRLRISCLATSALFREACQGSRKHRCGGCGRGGRGYEEQVVGHRSTTHIRSRKSRDQGTMQRDRHLQISHESLIRRSHASIGPCINPCPTPSANPDSSVDRARPGIRHMECAGATVSNRLTTGWPSAASLARNERRRVPRSTDKIPAAACRGVMAADSLVRGVTARSRRGPRKIRPIQARGGRVATRAIFQARDGRLVRRLIAGIGRNMPLGVMRGGERRVVAGGMQWRAVPPAPAQRVCVTAPRPGPGVQQARIPSDLLDRLRLPPFCSHPSFVWPRSRVHGTGSTRRGISRNAAAPGARPTARHLLDAVLHADWVRAECVGIAAGVLGLLYGLFHWAHARACCRHRWSRTHSQLLRLRHAGHATGHRPRWTAANAALRDAIV